AHVSTTDRAVTATADGVPPERRRGCLARRAVQRHAGHCDGCVPRRAGRDDHGRQGAGSLRQAIADACATDAITFDLGASPQSIVVATGELAIDKNLTIVGPGATLLTVDGNDASRVFHVLPNRTVTISDMTIANGMMNGDPSLLQIIGAGIFNEGTLTVARATLLDNNAPDTLQGAGGAIYIRAAFSDASLTIVDSTFSNNTAGISGGAVESGAIGRPAPSPTLPHPTFTGHSP